MIKNIDTPNVLLVDDDEKICVSLTNYLLKHNIKAAYVHSAPDMRAHLAAHPVDLLILDVMLPDEDGLSIAQSLRQESNIPIIMLTAKSQSQDRIQGMALGIDDYVTKPFEPEELLLRIQAVLRRHYQLPDTQSASAAQQVRFSNWILNLQTQQVTTSTGVKVMVSPKEIKLLMAFLENPNKVLDRDALLAATHATSSDASRRSVDVQITRLRQKLKKHDSSIDSIIKTAHGAGYVLTGPVTFFQS